MADNPTFLSPLLWASFERDRESLDQHWRADNVYSNWFNFSYFFVKKIRSYMEEIPLKTQFLWISYFEGQKPGKCTVFEDKNVFVYHVDRVSIYHSCKFECKILLRSWVRAIFPLKNARENSTSMLLISNTVSRPLCVFDVVSIA